MRSSTAWTSGTTLLAVDRIEASLGPAGGVQHRPFLCDVNLVAGKHSLDALFGSSFVGQFEQLVEGFIGNTVFRVIE